MNEIMIDLRSNSSKPLYEQIYEYIKNEIQSNRICADSKLPSTRALSKHLQLSRSTVDLAYEQLLSEGYIYSVPCKGYYVSQIEELYNISKSEPLIIPKESGKSLDIAYDFSPNGIDLENFPFNTWRKITRNTLIDDRRELFQLGTALGEPEFRKTICKYLHDARGVNCSYEQIVLGAGNDYLLMILSQIIDRSSIIAMENPTYKHAYRTFVNLNFKVNCISLDKNGMSIEELNKTDSNIAYVMPSHQFPLGVVMPIKRRMELLKWALGSEDRFIIEDDYDSEFRYKGKPIPALQGFDSSDKVIYIGTFSKSIAPAIRVSYMVLPKRLVGVYNSSGFYASTVSRIDQAILNCFINEGYFERHLNKMRGIYKNKHDLLINKLKELPNVSGVIGENAGVHLLVNFPGYINETELIEKAKENKVKVYGLSGYYINKPLDEMTTIILGYASLSEEDINSAVEILKRAWS